MEALSREWRLRQPELEGRSITSVYFGGGTPSLLGPEAIAEILGWITHEKDAEITLEANPETITPQLIRSYCDAGINRISIGIQSLDDSLLRLLSRQHNSAEACDAVHVTSESGIQNISVDLMYDLPNQTQDSWEKTLEQVRELPITHLSLYNLTFEPHTVFFKHRKKLQQLVPPPESSLRMYETAIAMLEEGNFSQYEISAFAKEGMVSRHNTGYWTGRPFLGLGPSAFSYWKGTRFRNIANINRYAQTLKEGFSPVDFEEELSQEAKERELLAINLRILSGVDLKRFLSISESILSKLVAEGFLQRDGDTVSLTKKGILFYDTVASEIV